MLYRQVNNDIIPCLESNLHLDFTGKILNSLSDWVHIENDKSNENVLGGLLDALQKRYGLDFAGHLEQIYHGETLHKTVEYMRKHFI